MGQRSEGNLKRGRVERWREGGVRGRRPVDERRSEEGGVEKDEVQGFNQKGDRCAGQRLQEELQLSRK